MSPADARRRTRRILLLLSAMLIPTAVVVALMFRVVRQERELAERRASEERRESLDQLRRELTARLQAIRLEQVNRLIGESGTRLPPDSPIVFVAPMRSDRVALPWDTDSVAPRPNPEFARQQGQGEVLEFQRHDARAASAAYERALAAARTPRERCVARILIGRIQVKAGRTADALSSDRETLTQCGAVADAEGVPFAFYAAERLIDHDPADGTVRSFLAASVGAQTWRPPNAAYALRSLLRQLPAALSAEPLRTLEIEIGNIEQIASLVRSMNEHPERLQRARGPAPGDLPWLGYGDDPWLVTLVSPTSFAPPVLMAVSSRRIVPGEVRLRTTPAAAAAPLGDGFVDLHAEWPPGRFDGTAAMPTVLYASIMFVVLGTVVFSGYLLLRDVHRETETAAMRSNFVASVSHELKTPLTSIRAHAETLLMGRAPGAETTSEYLKTIVSESERLTRLVDSVLEFSRIEQGRKTYRMQATRLDEIVRAAARTMEYPLSQLGFTLTISSDESEPRLIADPEALTQAVLNLLGNAMKYSGSARNIELRVGVRGSEAFVDVVDYGIGIPADDQAHIFERFHRVHSTETAGIAGAGLGLALALHVVEAHQGRIVVQSDVGRGSTFSVRLPLQDTA